MHLISRILIVASVLLFVSPARAQITNVTDTTSTPIPGAGHDYIHILNETVNPANGSVSLRIQVPTPPGRKMSLPFAFAYDSGGAQHLQPDGTGLNFWVDNTAYLDKGGWSYSVPMISELQVTEPAGQGRCTYYSNYVFQDETGGRHPLYLSIDAASAPCAQATPIVPVQKFSGGDDFYLAALTATSGPSPVLVASASGTVFSFGLASHPGGVDNVSTGLVSSIEDRNGNTLTVTDLGLNNDSGAFNVRDTLGRTILSSSSFGASSDTITVSSLSNPYTATWGSNSANQAVNSVLVRTDSNGCNGIPNLSGPPSVLKQITLPNNTSYTFSYDPSYGLLNKITYPGGGFVRYSWTLNPLSEFQALPDVLGGGNTGCLWHYDTPAVAQRSVSFDGVHIALQQTFSYSTTWSSVPQSWTTKTTTVTTTDNIAGLSYTTVYTYSAYTAPRQTNDYSPYQPQIPVEQTIVTKNSSGTTLRTVNKTWFDQYEIKSQQTVLENGLSSQTNYMYGPGAQITEQDDYDFGAGAPGGLLRKTVTNYQNFPSTPIYANGPSIFDRPCQTIVYDSSGGNRVAETDYFYDGSTSACGAAGTPSVAGVSGLPSGTHDETNYGVNSSAPRGNATMVTKQCLASCVSATSTYAYDETGQVTGVTDPRGNLTSYSFVDSYSSGTAPGQTNAYLTQVTYPNTGVAHVETFTYAYSDGQLTSSTDQNNHATNYFYNDSLRRLTETDYPDGGKTTITYSDTAPSPTVTTSKLITSALPLTSVVVMDGLGQAVQTQTTSDPDGTDYTDRTLDGLRHVWKQSNPHRSSSLSSDGTTTNYFDAIGRSCLIVPPDGAMPSGNPCSGQPSNTVFTSYSGNTVTVTDETGNSRTSVTDALGRLVEVDEPGAASPSTSGSGSGSISGAEQSIGGTPATSGTGSVTLNGTLQSKQVQSQTAVAGAGSVTLSGSLQNKQVQTHAATSGTGSVTIDGSEQSTCPPAPQLCSGQNKIWDSGTVSITVNGFTASASYGRSSTSGTIAAALQTALNASSSPVSAALSSSTLMLTGKATGTSSNYSLSATSNTNDPSDFNGPSFTPTPSGSTLTGGTNATYTTVYDSGTCTITVNSHGDSISWSGSGTTTSSIASALASSIGGDGAASVNALASGSTVNLTAKTTGAGTNYSLSSSCSYDSSNFSGPSFATANSGSTLTGGRDAAYTTVYDSGTSTITVNNHGTSYSWSGSGTTTSSIASALAANVNGDSAAFVNASASGNTVTLTARTIGVSTNYALSSSSTYDSSNFSSASFTSTNSGSNLTGGTNVGATTYDTGTVWITTAGFKVTASYGQNDTSTSVASALTNALNVAGSPVVASASGTTISLAAKAAGANTNYLLSGGSSTNQPSSFSQPSFSISLSGSTLTGGSSPTLSLSAPAITTYNYDALDNLVSVVQSGSRQRTFTSDSLSRLVCASNPENSSAACPATGSYTPGTIGYTYDANGNLITKTAPAPNQPGTATVTTTYAYDALNRLTQKSYSDGTPTVQHGYDAVAPPGCTLPSLTINNGIGKRTGMCDAAGAEAWSYDIVSGTGWKTMDARTTSGVTLTTPSVVQNNLDGSINSITYPSSHVITYDVRGAGLPISATDTTASINYAANATYWPSGALASLTNNGSSLSSTYIFNSRLQPCWIYSTTGSALPWNSTACTVSFATGNILDLKYNFNLGVVDNGNVLGITNNHDTTRSQTFAYDPLNRLIIAQTTSTYSTSTANCFGEAFGYDAWGNLLSIGESSSAYDGCTQEWQGWSLNSKNQIQASTACFDGSGNLLTVATYCYDAAGNLMTDTARSYYYNAENQLKSIPMLGISYVYDGDGRRVAKLNSSGQATKLYWYGTGSDPLDETDGAGATNNESFFEYAFFVGKRTARRDASNNVSYYLADHLGSARVVTNASGTILDDSDYYPFGGERAITSPSGNTYKFTGKERDTESGLDNFGVRYDSSNTGRFMSPDPDNAGAINENPQSWNGYAYALNNPLRYTDPDGTNVLVCIDGQDKCHNYTDDQYARLLKEQNGKQGINLPNQGLPNGDITCGGVKCGTATYFEPPMESANGMNMLMFAPFAGLVTGSMSAAEGAAGAAARQGGTQATNGAATATEQVIANGAKGTVRQLVEDSALNSAQKAAVKSALNRAGSGANITVEKLADGSVRVLTERAGRVGSQVIEKVIDGAGNTTSVVQRAYDAAGNLVHVDPKFP